MLLLLPVLFFVLMACNSGSDKKTESADSSTLVKPEIKKEPVLTASYSGVIPCPDCKGIEVNINLMDNGTFTKRDLYIERKSEGAGSNEVSKAGNYMMHGDTLHLQGITDGPDMYLRTDTSLIQLGADGKMITGNLADKYVLKKVNP